MGYSGDPQLVRVDFFKPSGKWYTTEAIRWSRYRGTDADGKITLVDDAFREALAQHLKKHAFTESSIRCKHCNRVVGGDVNAASYCEEAPHRLGGMTAVCLEPYHEHAHPMMVLVPGGQE